MGLSEDTAATARLTVHPGSREHGQSYVRRARRRRKLFYKRVRGEHSYIYKYRRVLYTYL